ncbi:aldehyde dehydrogenase [Variovorax sp. Sphag1AA]|uniref:aldehyde dehydrogenase family protein n=1 Tax=Variovorax sp. Sphag1AA TaxID=2587027 RepID=UPI0016099D2C|nr:aldehyde dehydrogenase family protein [Variovorax sp. Sphag1AA]MBB3177980.1 aldehyde dehydrogenase (NAD+) [Variovorax sp. Sphag1AA]
MHSFAPDTVELDRRSFVDGNFLENKGAPIEVHRPSDGKIAAVFHEADEGVVDHAVTAAKEALKRSGWATAAPRQRAAVMRRWAALVEKHSLAMAQLESVCSSRPIAETLERDVPVAIELLRFYGECADKTSGEVFETPRDVWSLTLHEPYGVVAAISPWNVPLLLATAKFAPALAAGNAVVLKPSELTPFSALRMAALAVEAGLPHGLFNVLVGTGQHTGSALVRHPGVSYVTFTGSTRTGAAVMTDAAHHGMKPVSLELGGKSPQLVFADAPDLGRVAEMVASSITRNSGQICFCGSRLVVQRDVAQNLLERIVDRVKTARPGPTWSEATTLPPLISMPQAERAQRIVDQARAAGGELVCGGQRFMDGKAVFFEPTVITNVQPGSEVLRDEVFGPVLTVQTFDNYEEGLALAAHPLYGLSAGIHTSDIDKALAAAQSVEAGVVWVNAYGRSDDIVSPFGGFKQSGFGKDFGVAAFEKYRRARNVWIRLGQPRAAAEAAHAEIAK